MPNTKDIPAPIARRLGTDYWHVNRYPVFTGRRLMERRALLRVGAVVGVYALWRGLGPFVEHGVTSEIEPPLRTGASRVVRVFGPIGFALGQWSDASLLEELVAMMPTTTERQRRRQHRAATRLVRRQQPLARRSPFPSDIDVSVTPETALEYYT